MEPITFNMRVFALCLPGIRVIKPDGLNHREANEIDLEEVVRRF